MNSELDRILSAKSIAIIGASNNPAKRGYQAVKKLLDDRFAGSIYPINPKTPEVLGLKAHASVLDVADDIDMALVCTPAKTLPDVLADCGKKGIAGIVALAAGFNEIGAEGETLTAACIEAARVNNVRIVGPNTNGVFNLHNRMNLVGVNDIDIGHIGIVSQSGNMLVAFTTEAKRRGGLGFPLMSVWATNSIFDSTSILNTSAMMRAPKFPYSTLKVSRMAGTFWMFAERFVKRNPLSYTNPAELKPVGLLPFPTQEHWRVVSI